MNQSVPIICQEKAIVKLTQKTKQLLFMKKSILTSIALVLVAFAANAQLSATHTVTVTIPTVMDVRFQPSGPNNTTFTFADGAEIETGKENLNASGLQVRSNKNWKLSVKAGQANFTPSTTVALAMPASILSVKRGTGAYLGLTTVDQELTTGNKGGYGANTFNVDYRALPSFDHEPATYTLPVVYTVSAQ
ncbi:hypothetical protein EGI31_04875 [Lacihabitans soyangensis]|uniref:WxL domain-containing protein n=2 Tax=Lacihabitans soyangensis TaxID=869394 RepID=A0AAE3KS71_9BACT|nr:hypothetical protein [Lacihabitans soyangensis]